MPYPYILPICSGHNCWVWLGTIRPLHCLEDHGNGSSNAKSAGVTGSSGCPPTCPKTLLPDRFWGSRASFYVFTSQCKLLFNLQPSGFPNDTIKVGFISSLL
ncbi:hypothetical protein XENTR_v10008023 [Xenopus tropicalis]|nr:hypothetical protein XENTR_v10008023 [Xenopus tropicalis]